MLNTFSQFRLLAVLTTLPFPSLLLTLLTLLTLLSSLTTALAMSASSSSSPSNPLYANELSPALPPNTAFPSNPPWKPLFTSDISPILKHAPLLTFSLATVSENLQPHVRTLTWPGGFFGEVPDGASPANLDPASIKKNPKSESDLLFFITDSRANKYRDLSQISRFVEACFYLQHSQDEHPVSAQWRLKGYTIMLDSSSSHPSMEEELKALKSHLTHSESDNKGWTYENELLKLWLRVPPFLKGKYTEGPGIDVSKEEKKNPLYVPPTFKPVIIIPTEVELLMARPPFTHTTWKREIRGGTVKWVEVGAKPSEKEGKKLDDIKSEL